MKKILIPAMLALLLLTAGCDKPSGENTPPDNPAQTKPVTAPEKNSETLKIKNSFY